MLISFRALWLRWLAILSACFVLLPLLSSAQTLNPPYLSGMPSVAKVEQVMQGSDPTDTLARQVAVFNLLPQVIQRFVLADRSRYHQTPDEQRITGQYQLAAYQLEQGYDKTHTPAEAKAFQSLHWKYESDGPFYHDMFSKLFSPAFMAEYQKVDRSVNTWYQAHVDQERRVNEQAQQQAQQSQGQSSGMANDAGSVAVRRCLEEGSSQTECLGKGLPVGMDELTGGLMGQIDKATTPPPGLRLSGNYGGAGFGVSFDDKVATVFCGQLDPQPVTYRVERGSQVSVTIGTSPKPVTLAVRPDGKLVGPGPVPIAGVVPIGHGGGGPAGAPASAYNSHPVTTTQEQQISAAEVGQYSADQVHQNGMEYSVTTTQPSSMRSDTSWAKPRAARPVAPKTERCNVATLTGSAATKMSAAVGQMLGDATANSASIPAGLRMYGKYSEQSGPAIQFEGDLATIECGRARAAEPYTVENSAGHITVHVQNPSGPFSLTLEPNGTLAGSGTMDVAGKVLTGHNGNQMIYAPVSGKCSLGTLSPQRDQ